MQPNPLMGRVHRVSVVCQRLPSFPGKLRVASWLVRKELAAQDVIVADSRGNRFVMPDLREPMALHLLINGVYEADLLKFIQSSLPADGCFVDVGANVGLFTVAVAKSLTGGGRVFAAEASHKIYRYLCVNMALNGLENVSTCHVAAADHASVGVPFYDAPTEKFGMGSLAQQFCGKPTPVATETLDNLLDESFARCVRVLKIDVEGFEAAVLRGATRLLTQTPPPLVAFEFAAWAEGRDGAEGVGAAQRVLRDLDYEVWRLRDWTRGTKPLDTIVTVGSEMLVGQRREKA